MVSYAGRRMIDWAGASADGKVVGAGDGRAKIGLRRRHRVAQGSAFGELGGGQYALDRVRSYS